MRWPYEGIRRAAAGVVLAWVLHAPAMGQAAPVFVATSCDGVAAPADVRPRLRCGTVGVPRNYASPAAGSFDLAVVVIRSAQQPALPDPAVYISGGPGGPLTVYAGAQAQRPLAIGRDIILVDQRGTGRSQPRLCPGLAARFVVDAAALAIDPLPAAQARRQADYQACHDQAVAQGIDLNDFGTTVTVEDFDRVRQALGVAQWNVFGVSYGTTVAMTLMARHPETLRSVVLDSVYPPDPILPPWKLNVADARASFFAACTRNEACAGAYPDLAALYAATLAGLQQSPPTMALPPAMHEPGNQGPATAALFELVVGRMIYYPNFYPGLPQLIAAVHDGDTTGLVAIVAAQLAQEADPATGTDAADHAAVECRDRPRYRRPMLDAADIFDLIQLHGVCDGWASLGPPPLVPSDTPIPTLILAGEFDPNARPAASRHVADLMGRQARWLAFPGMGHSVRAFSPCARQVVAAFFDDPAASIENACAGQPSPVTFLPKASP